MYWVYAIVHKSSGMRYVGSTQNLHQRVMAHKTSLIRRIHVCKPFQKLFDTSGWEAFQVKELYHYKGKATATELRWKREEAAISRAHKRGTLLNSSLRAKGWGLDNNPRALARYKKRMSLCNTGEGNPMHGKRHTIEARRKMSKANKGNSYAKGSIRNKRQRAEMSKLASTRTGSSNSFYGKQHSAETRKRLSELKKGSLPPNSVAVIVDGVRYDSLTKACKGVGVCFVTLMKRVNSVDPKYKKYRLVRN